VTFKTGKSFKMFCEIEPGRRPQCRTDRKSWRSVCFPQSTHRNIAVFRQYRQNLTVYCNIAILQSSSSTGNTLQYIATLQHYSSQAVQATRYSTLQHCSLQTVQATCYSTLQHYSPQADQASHYSTLLLLLLLCYYCYLEKCWMINFNFLEGEE
jgi:hypothetical protein